MLRAVDSERVSNDAADNGCVEFKYTPMVAEFLRDAPEFVTASWVAARFGITPAAVSVAIRSGRLPAKSVARGISADSRTSMWLIRPEHTLLVWGHRLLSETEEPEL